METSTSTNSKSNIETDNQESSPNTATKDSIDASLDTKAGGDIEICVDPPATNTGTSQTESVSDNSKSESFDLDDKAKTTTGGDSVSDRPITPSGSQNDVCDSPDFNIFNKTNNLLNLPRSVTGRSTPATDSSEMLEEDIVLKWDDDDEENEKLEESKPSEQDVNSNMEGNETTVIEKLSALESKVDHVSTDAAKQDVNLDSNMEGNETTVIEKSSDIESKVDHDSADAAEQGVNLNNDTVLKWDDDDEENKKLEESKSSEQDVNLNSNMGGNETTVIEKLTVLESKVDNTDAMEQDVNLNSNMKGNERTELTVLESKVDQDSTEAVEQDVNLNTNMEGNQTTVVEKLSDLESKVDHDSADAAIQDVNLNSNMESNEITVIEKSDLENKDATKPDANVNINIEGNETTVIEKSTDLESKVDDHSADAAKQDISLNSNIEGSEIRVIEKQSEKSSDLESKLDHDSTDAAKQNINVKSNIEGNKITVVEKQINKLSDLESKVEHNSTDAANQDVNLNSSMECSDITVVEKQIEKLYDLESKVDDDNINASGKKNHPTEMKKSVQHLNKNDGDTLGEENKEPENSSAENLITSLEKIIDDESASKQNKSTHEIAIDQIEMNLTDSIEIAPTSEETHGVADDFEIEKINNETELNKNTTSIENIISNLDQMLDEDDENHVNKENDDSSLNRKTDQTQSNFSVSADLQVSTENSISDTKNVDSTEDTQMDVDKVSTSVCNVITNLDQMMETDHKEDSSLEAKSDKEQADLRVKSSSSFMDTRNENKSENDVQGNIKQITTCDHNTNLNPLITRSEDKTINVEKLDTSITNQENRNPDLNSLTNKMDTDNCIKSGSDSEIVDITDTKTIEKSLDLGEPFEVQKITIPNETEHKSVQEDCKIDSHDSEIDSVVKEKFADIIFPAKSMSESENNSELDMSTSNSFLNATLEEKEHNLIKPNMMTEIPSQSMIDFDDSLDVTHNESIDAKCQDDSMQKPKENIAGDSQKEDNASEETSNKLEISKTDSEVKDTIRQDLNAIEDKQSKQTSTTDNKTEISVTIKETESDKIETKVTKQIGSDKITTESSAKINDTPVKIRDETEPTVALVTSLKTTDQIKDQTIQEDANLVETKASSSQMDPDTSDEVPEVTDSLGLLAESSRVMEDDEEQETSDHDEGDDEEDFDQDDESSNQMTTEQDSNDSNTPQQSETDTPKAPLTQADVQTELDIEDDSNDDNAQDLIEGTDDVVEMETEDVQSESNVEADAIDKEGDVDIGEDMVIDEVDIAATAAVEADRADQSLLDLEAAVAEAAEELEKVDTVEEPPKESTSDIETVKLSDSSDVEEDSPKKQSTSILKTLIGSDDSAATPEKSSPAKTKKLEIFKQKPPLNFVDLEESSSEDEPPADVQVVPKEVEDDVTSVNIPSEIEIMSVGENTSDIVTKEKEVVISGVPKPPPVKVARLNTSEVTIKTTTTTEPTPSLVIPEVKGDKSKFGLEVFNLDSDEEEPAPAKAPTPPPEPTPPSIPPEPQKPQKSHEKRNRCINDACTSDSSIPHAPAPRAARAIYAPQHTKKAQICERCAQAVVDRSKSLVSDIRSFAPLLQLDMGHHRQELVEISDSDSEGEREAEEEEKVPIGWKGAAMLDQLTEMINESWREFKMDARLKEAEKALQIQQDFQESELKELGAILDECQVATDKLRNELYATFEPEKKELPSLIIFDTPDNMYSLMVPSQLELEKNASGAQKRRLSSASDTPNKKVAMPLGMPAYEAKADAVPEPKIPLSTPQATVPDDKNDDDKDISVVQLSAEAAPPSLPPPGEPRRPRVHPNMQVYAMRNAFGSWLRAKVVECTLKGTAPSAAQFSQCRVKFESKTHKNAFKTLAARCLAYSEPSEVRMTIGTRIIALFKEKDKEDQQKRESYYSGIVAEVPNPVNNFRYLVFFDDGYAQYVQHADTRLVCEFSSLVWEEVHPFSREFVRQYLLAYPERPMVRLHTGQSLKTEWNGKWWTCKVLQVDASLVHVHFEKDNRTEWIYRGSTRLAPLYLELQAAERHRARPLPRNRLANQTNMPYVEYTRSEEQTAPDKPAATNTQIQAQEELRRQRAVAKKSTTPAPAPPAAPPQAAETVTSRVVYYTPKNAVKPYKITAHTCSPKCKRSDVLSLKELRTYNPLAKPLLSGWERQILRFKGHKEVMYRAPCGRRIRDMRELHRYLRTTKSEMSVDLFDFASTTHCLAEFVLNRCIVSKKDLSNGKENVPVPCVNYYDDSLPEFCSYNTERTPTEGVPLNLDPGFLCGCDCTDDCEDKSKCACWKLTLEGARTIGLDGDVGYEYRRLPEPLPSGIYECNSRCKCKQTCLNRVAQHPLQLKLQVFKTINRGWGIRALNDVPKGAFLCVYAGNLLTDATANLDGLNEGDEYLAELDYIEVVEQMKQGYEDDIPDKDKKLDKEGQTSSSSSSSEDERPSYNEANDGDFEPGDIGLGLQDFSKRLRKRNRSRRKETAAPPNGRGSAAEGEECITISDDEELREPARFAAQPGMGAEFISKHRSVRSYFGKDEACYIMDAKVQGNIGRYLNHSCSPNVFVQNVFVDTHDPRFPWVAFFALRAVRAGTELTWNYNYDVGSVPGKVLYCHCGAANCRGRLL